MANTNKRMYNPITNQEIRFLQTAADTQGVLLEMESVYRGKSAKPALHYHPNQDETFTVLQGKLQVILEGRSLLFHAGDTLHIPRGCIHSMWNDTDDTTVVNWKVQPAMDTEHFLETAMGLAADGKTNRHGMPGILQAALMMNYFANTFRLASPPAFIQKMVFGMLRPIARLRGLRPVYTEYIS